VSLKIILLKRPLISFFVLTYLISWLIWFPVVIYYYLNPFPLSFSSTPLSLILITFLGFFGPTFAAMIMAILQNDKAGLGKLFSRWKIWKVGVQWYLVIPIFFLTLSFIALQLYIFFDMVSPEVNWGMLYLIIPSFIQAAIIGGSIAEETGWRGYALPNLMKSRNALTSSLIIGVIWGFWHFPLLLIPGANIPVPLNVSSLSLFVLNSIALSVIIAWLFNNTRGSVFITYLFHTAANSISLLSIVYKFSDFQTAWLDYMWFNLLIKGIFLAFLIVFFRPTFLSRQFEAKENFLIALGIVESNEEGGK